MTSLRLSQEAELILIHPDYSYPLAVYEDLGETRVWSPSGTAEKLLSLPLAVYARFESTHGGQMDEPAELLKVVARIRNNLHRSIQLYRGAAYPYDQTRTLKQPKVKGQFSILYCGHRCC